MRSVFALLRHFLFLAPILRLFFLLGALMFFAGVLLNDELGRLLKILGAGLIFFPLLFAGWEFRKLIGNRRFQLIPHFRGRAVLALLVLTLLGAALFGSAITSTGRTSAPIDYLLVFSAVSWLIWVSQWLVTRPFGSLYFLSFLGVTHLLKRPSVQTVLLPLATPVLWASATLIGWMIFWYWATHARHIKPALSAYGGTHNSPMARWLAGGKPRSAQGSILRGSMDSWRNRLLTQFMYYLGFPLGVVVWLLIMNFTTTGRALTGDVEMILLCGSSGVFVSGCVAYEWVGRARLLWLRLGGERSELWQLIERSLWQDQLLGALAGTVFVALLVSLFQLDRTLGFYFIVLSVAGTAFFNYSMMSLRFIGLGLFASTIAAGVVMAGGIGLIAYAHVHELPMLMLLLVVLLMLPAACFRMLVLRYFQTVDWCLHKPMVARGGMRSYRSN